MTADPMDAVKDHQVGGDHYRIESGVQPWDVIEAFQLDFWEGTALKYLLRYRRKNGREDLEKCIHYLQYLLARWDREHAAAGPVAESSPV